MTAERVMDFTVTMVPAVYHIHQYVMVIDIALMELMNMTVVSFLSCVFTDCNKICVKFCFIIIR